MTDEQVIEWAKEKGYIHNKRSPYYFSKIYDGEDYPSGMMTDVVGFSAMREFAEQSVTPNKKFKGEWGIRTLREVLENLEVADNFGDVAECIDALRAIIAELPKELESE